MDLSVSPNAEIESFCVSMDDSILAVSVNASNLILYKLSDIINGQEHAQFIKDYKMKSSVIIKIEFSLRNTLMCVGKLSVGGNYK
jgi:hypothetical protein